MSKSVAFFDFDGTLTHGDSLIPFLYMVRGRLKFGSDLLLASPWLIAYVAGVMKNDRAKEVLLRTSICGISIDELNGFGAYFAEHRISKMLRSDTVERFHEHKAQGHLCVLVSASLDVYLKPWSVLFGFDHCIASSLEVGRNGLITGALQANNCFGEEKVRRIELLLEEIEEFSRSYAYGDSQGDIPMLEMVDEGFRVKKVFKFTKKNRIKPPA